MAGAMRHGHGLTAVMASAWLACLLVVASLEAAVLVAASPPAGCMVQDRVLISCANFTGSVLELASLDFTAIAPDALQGLHATLTSVSLRQIQDLEEIPESLLTTRPPLQHLTAFVLVGSPLVTQVPAGLLAGNLSSFAKFTLADSPNVRSLPPTLFQPVSSTIKAVNVQSTGLEGALAPPLLDNLTVATDVLFQDCRLTYIVPGALRHLHSVTKLYFDNNYINAISPGTLIGVANATLDGCELSLLGNELMLLPPKVFADLPLGSLARIGGQRESAPPDAGLDCPSPCHVGPVLRFTGGIHSANGCPPGSFEEVEATTDNGGFCTAYPPLCEVVTQLATPENGYQASVTLESCAAQAASWSSLGGPAPVLRVENVGLTHIAERALRDLVVNQVSFRNNFLTSISEAAWGDLTIEGTSTEQPPDVPGAAVVQLSFNNFASIADAVPAEVMSAWPPLSLLALDSNSITTLHAGELAGLTTHSLMLQSNRIASIEAGAFNGVALTGSLQLGFNAIAELTRAMFVPSGSAPAPTPASATLQHLCATNNELTALGQHLLVSLPALQSLQLRHNELTTQGLQPAFAALEASSSSYSLASLRLDHNKVATLPRAMLAKCTALQCLYVANCGMTSVDAASLEGLSALQQLDVSFNALTTLPQGWLRHVSSTLTALRIHQNSFDSLGYMVFGGLASGVLAGNGFLVGSKPCGRGVWVEDDHGMSYCSAFPAHACTLQPSTDPARRMLTSCANFTALAGAAALLQLSNQGITGIAPHAFAGLTTSGVDLSGNRLTGDLPSHALGGLTVEGSLTLAGNNLTGIADSAFYGTKVTNLLDLRSNALSTLAPGALRELLVTVEIDLRDNPLSYVPPEIAGGGGEDGFVGVVRASLSSCAQAGRGNILWKSSVVCSLCPVGHYCPQDVSTPHSCPLGSYSSTPGLVSAEQCTKCPAGTYSDVSGATTGAQCTFCSSGTFNPSPGASSAAACLGCPAGFYGATTGRAVCQRCSPGTFNPDTGAASSTACVACVPQAIDATQQPVTPVGDTAGVLRVQAVATIVALVLAVVLLLVLVCLGPHRALAFDKLYTTTHWLHEGQVIKKHRSAQGGAMTVILVVLATAMAAVLVAAFAINNITVTASQVPFDTPQAGSLLSVIIDMKGVGPSTCEDLAQRTATASVGGSGGSELGVTVTGLSEVPRAGVARGGQSSASSELVDISVHPGTTASGSNDCFVEVVSRGEVTVTAAAIVSVHMAQAPQLATIEASVTSGVPQVEAGATTTSDTVAVAAAAQQRSIAHASVQGTVNGTLVGISSCDVTLVPSRYTSVSTNTSATGFHVATARCSVCKGRAASTTHGSFANWGLAINLQRSAAGSFVVVVDQRDSLVQAAAALLSGVAGLFAFSKVVFVGCERVTQPCVEAMERRRARRGKGDKGNSAGPKAFNKLQGRDGQGAQSAAAAAAANGAALAIELSTHRAAAAPPQRVSHKPEVYVNPMHT